MLSCDALRKISVHRIFAFISLCFDKFNQVARPDRLQHLTSSTESLQLYEYLLTIKHIHFIRGSSTED